MSRRPGPAFFWNTGGKPRLVFLIPSLAGGGAERVASRILPHLADRYSVTVILVQNLRQIALPESLTMICLSPALPGNLANIIRTPFHILKLAYHVRRFKTDTVMSFMEQGNLLNLAASFLTGHKTVISQRTNPLHQYAKKGWLGKSIRFLSSRLYGRSNGVIAVSEGVGDQILNDYRLDKERLCIIPNPVDIGELQTTAAKTPSLPLPEKYILQVGRLDMKTKGQDLTLRALAEIEERKNGLRIPVVFVGEGPDREDIEDLAVELELSDRVHFAGWQPEVAPFMARAAALVLPSRYEGWPNVLVEAMACGCPVAAADCESGPREILQGGEYGILFSTEDPSALADGILRLVEDGPFRSRLVSSGKRRAADFDIQKIAERYIDFVERVRGPGRP